MVLGYSSPCKLVQLEIDTAAAESLVSPIPSSLLPAPTPGLHPMLSGGGPRRAGKHPQGKWFFQPRLPLYLLLWVRKSFLLVHLNSTCRSPFSLILPPEEILIKQNPHLQRTTLRCLKVSCVKSPLHNSWLLPPSRRRLTFRAGRPPPVRTQSSECPCAMALSPTSQSGLHRIWSLPPTPALSYLPGPLHASCPSKRQCLFMRSHLPCLQTQRGNKS